MSTIGDPLSDLATTLAYWADPGDSDELRRNLSDVTLLDGSLSRKQAVELYAARTKSDVSQIHFYLAFARFKLAVIVQQIFFRYNQGLTRDPRFATLPGRVHTLLRASHQTILTREI